jgi:hypothetical protein
MGQSPKRTLGLQQTRIGKLRLHIKDVSPTDEEGSISARSSSNPGVH